MIVSVIVGAFVPTLLASSALLAAAVLLFLLLKWLRKRLNETPEATAPLTIEEAERLKAAGEIDAEEFSRLRRICLGLPPAAKDATAGKDESVLTSSDKPDDDEDDDDADADSGPDRSDGPARQ